MKKTNSLISEMRGAERAFQLNRDTLLVYTGLHERDFRPFIRFGSSPTSVPVGLLRHIENVVLPEDDPVNAAVEVAWIDAALRAGSDHIRYVGSRERINQINSFAGLKDKTPGEESPIESLAYRAVKPGSSTEKDKSLLTFFATGNVNVTVGGSRVLDYSSFKRSVLHIDREYEMISRSLRKSLRKCESGTGFLFTDEKTPAGIALYWNFEKAGLFVNPPLDPHYSLFQNSIDPENLNMVATASPYGPGFAEILRRKNAEAREIGIYCPDQERLGVLKKIYNRAIFKTYEDMRPLPFARSTVSFISKSGSHMLFAIKPEKASQEVLALFPLGAGKKESKSFAYFKPPYDLEIMRYADKNDLESRAGRLLFLVPGEISARQFKKLKLDCDFYPLVRHRHYRIHSAESPAEHVDAFARGLKGTDYEAVFNDLLLQAIGFEYDAIRLSTILNEIVKMPRSADVVIKNNLAAVIKFVMGLHEYKMRFDDYSKKQMERIRKRFSHGGSRFADWLNLDSKNIAFDVLVYRNIVCLTAVPAMEDQLRFPIPPAIEELEKDPRAFAKELRRLEKQIHRQADQSLIGRLEVVQKIYEERLRLSAERKRFYELLDRLGIALKSREIDIVHKSLPPALNDFLINVRNFFRRMWQGLKERLR